MAQTNFESRFSINEEVRYTEDSIPNSKWKIKMIAFSESKVYYFIESLFHKVMQEDGSLLPKIKNMVPSNFIERFIDTN